MKRLELDPILRRIEETVRQHELGPGRYFLQTEEQANRPGADVYGCAAAAYILYALNRFPRERSEREAFVRTLQAFQDESGIFWSGSHHVIHTTAHCVGALDLFDARALHPFTELEEYRQVESVFDMLEERDWLHRGLGAHPAAGIYTVMVMNGLVGDDWTQKYFDWLTLKCDPDTGFWKEEPTEDTYICWQQMRDAANFLFNFEYASIPHPHPEALIDSCLNLYCLNQMPDDFGKKARYFELDWVYCLNRASRQTAYRFDEIKRSLRRFAGEYIDYLNGLDWEKDETADNLHNVLGVLCCLIELQKALPGELHSSAPLRQVLDRKPF